MGHIQQAISALSTATGKDQIFITLSLGYYGMQYPKT
jgi:hypothetical protein